MTYIYRNYNAEPSPNPNILALLAGKGMIGTREIVGLNMNNIHRISHYII